MTSMPVQPRAILMALVLLPALAGCSLLGGRDAPVVHYVLSDGAAPDPGQVAAPSPGGAGVLLLRETEAAGLCQGGQMLYSRQPGQVDAYQFAFWNEPLGRGLNQLLKSRLNAQGPYAAVASLASGVAGDWQLNTRLLRCHHDLHPQSPGLARLSLEAELIRRDTARLLQRRVFEVDVPVASANAEAAAAAFSRAATGLLDQVVAWLGSQPGR